MKTEIGAFLMDGMLEEATPLDLSIVAECRGYGWIELVLELTSYTNYIQDLIDKADQEDFEYMGVLHYEVIAEIGKDFAKNLITLRYIPSDVMMRNSILHEFIEFFTGAVDSDEERAKILQAFYSVPFKGEVFLSTFNVSWSMDVEAVSHKAAAQYALKVQRDPASIATEFVVEGCGQTLSIDLRCENEDLY